MTEFVAFQDIPQDVVTLINRVVLTEEGGWFLNPVDNNDLDGGWTFGGMTSELYNKFYETDATKNKPIVRSTIAVVVSTEFGRQQHRNDCIVVYYNDFVLPILKWTGDEECHEDQFSCAINLGMEQFKKLWSDLIKDDPHAAFVERWKDHYVELVVENAKAWKEYALACEADLPQDLNREQLEAVEAKKPKSLRAIYLAGWLSRVARYA